jgi:hypothetical protein
MGPSQRTDRRALTTVAVVAVVVVAGCNGLDVGGIADGDTTTDSAPVETLSDAVTTGAGQSAATIHIDTRISGNGTTVVENTTVRVGPNGSVHTERSRRFPDANVSNAITESYTEGNVTLSRYTTSDSNVSTYDYTVTGAPTAFGVERLDEQFEFTHERVGERTHRFTVDSTDQITGSVPVEGTVENVSAVAVVESRLLVELRYELDIATDAGVVEYRTVRTVSDRGSTTVSEPEWLSDARQRTGAPSDDADADED